MLRVSTVARLFVILGMLALLAACAVNPATGKRQLVLISEQQEVQIGAENDRALTAQLGLYPDDDLQAYVQRLGESIAAKSERPHLDWHFRVVDDPVINAFALPGGYVYITRGILAHFNNEAELVSVLGHEIGHVTARHGVNQMSKQQLAQIGLMGGMIAAPEKMQEYGQLAEMGLGMMFLKFSRDDERQADDLGLRYLLDGGYDPRPMPDVFDTLARVSAAQGSERLPGWMSTHPVPENRRDRIDARIAASGQDFSGQAVRREEYLARVDGIAFGEDPRQGYFRDGLFLHPEMKFQLRFPEGWKTMNQRDAVVGVSPEGDAVVQLTLADEAPPSAAHGKFFGQEGLQRTDWPLEMAAGLPTAASAFQAETQQGTIRGIAAFVEHGGNVFQLLAYTPQPQWGDRSQALESALTSFDRVRDAGVLAARVKRMEVIKVSTAMSLPEFARRYGATVTPEELALINGLEPGARLRAGRSYKVVRGGSAP